MEHKIIPATWKSKETLLEKIKSHEKEQWSVAALGEIFGGDLLILVKNGKYYEHEMIPVMVKTRKKVEGIIAEKEAEGWQVCAIGECFDNAIMIVKKHRS